MSTAALQLIGNEFAASGAWGTAAWGTSPWGGQAYDPLALPTVGLGSDNVTALRSRGIGDIVLSRRGQAVSVRPFASWGVWRVTLPLLTEAELDALWPFCEARVFRLLPDKDNPGTYRTVRWANSDFLPDNLGNGKYALSFELEEVAT